MTQTPRWTIAVLLLIVAATILPKSSAGQALHKDAVQRANTIKESQLKLLGRTSTLVTSQLAEKITYMWEENEWNPDARSEYTYGEIGRAASWDYRWDGSGWTNTYVTKYIPFGNTFTESVVEVYDEVTGDWMPLDKTVFDYLIEPATGAPYVNWTLYQSWDGEAWVDTERETYSYDNETRLTGGQTDVWEDAWTPYSRYTVEQVGDDVVFTDQERINDAWTNTERSIYRGWSVKDLYRRLMEIGTEIADYDGLMFGFHILPDVVAQEWDGEQWVNVGRQSRTYDLFSGAVVDVIYEEWLEGDWVEVMRYRHTYSSPGVVETISSDVFDGETWMTFALDTYSHDDDGAISEVIQQVNMGEGLQNAGRITLDWNHLGSDAETDDVPGGFALDPAYPNPFNPATHMTYRLAASGNVAVRVYDALGRHVATLVEGMLPAGSHEVTFEGANLPSGQYIVRMEADGFTQSRVVTLLK